MNDSMRATIETLTAKVEQKSRELLELKRTVNILAREAGLAPVYEEETVSDLGSVGTVSLRADEFYGKSAVTAAREYLGRRAMAVGADDILAALERGGFDFAFQGWKKDDRLRALSVCLSKNSGIFHRLPNGTYGLVSFYPNAQERKATKRGSGQSLAEKDEVDSDETSNVDTSREPGQGAAVGNAV